MISRENVNDKSDRLPSSSHTVEEFSLIWFDLSIQNSTREFNNAEVELRRIINLIQMFDDFNQCVDYLKQPRSEKLIMIISTSVGHEILSSIHRFPQLQSIYVFGEKSLNDDLWTRGWKKVKGVFTTIKSIVDSLKTEIRQYEDDSTMITITSSTCPINATSNELDQSFMYSQILHEILLDMDHPDRAKADLVKFCREYYAENANQLTMIDEFDRDYTRLLPYDTIKRDGSPIWWYTRECFVYSMLNKALRTLDIDTMIKMGFLMQDIHRQIEQIHRQSTRLDRFIVYRGQLMTNTEFERMRANIGGLISFNSFLSTSINRNTAQRFAERIPRNSDMTILLFKMTIDPSSLFASLDDISFFNGDEKEVLFSMNTVFRIGQVRSLKSNWWEVELELTHDNDEQLKILIQQTRKEIGKGPPMDRIGSLLVKMGKFDTAESIYTTLLKSTITNDWPMVAHINNQLGYIAKQKGDLTEASRLYKKTLDIQLENLSPDDLILATTYSNIGTIYDCMQELPEALHYYKNALRIKQKSLSEDDPLMATTYSNIGLVYSLLEDCSTGLLFLQRAIAIQEKHLSTNDPSLATTYNNLGKTYGLLQDYPAALSYYQKACHVFLKSLPSDHPSLAAVYNNIGHSYDRMEDYPKALEYYQMTLEIKQKSMSTYHPSLAITYNNLGFVHKEMEQYTIALECFEKALDIEQHCTPRNHEHVQELKVQISTVRAKR